MDFVVIDV